MKSIIVHGLKPEQKRRAEELLRRLNVPASDVSIYTTGTMTGLFTVKVAIHSGGAQAIDATITLKNPHPFPPYPWLAPQKFVDALESLFGKQEEQEFVDALDSLLGEPP